VCVCVCVYVHKFSRGSAYESVVCVFVALCGCVSISISISISIPIYRSATQPRWITQMARKYCKNLETMDMVSNNPLHTAETIRAACAAICYRMLTYTDACCRWATTQFALLRPFGMSQRPVPLIIGISLWRIWCASSFVCMYVYLYICMCVQVLTSSDMCVCV
jgi:hypothetical protein